MQQNRNGSFVPAIISAALSQSVTRFGWTYLDGIEVPFIQRDAHKLFPVKIAELKFLSKFTDIVQFNVPNPLFSHYMLETEALALTNSGCGEIFTTRDLLVKVDEFARFYEEVKEKCTKDCSSSKRANVDGGWVQINNTVVPYIVKDDSVMIPLAIVRCAAGLLVGRDVPVVYPDDDECRFLNDSCKNAGISFDFTKATELVEQVLMSCMSDPRPFIRQLPSSNPFSAAQAALDECSNKVSTIPDVSNTQPINLLPAKTPPPYSPPPYPGHTCNQQPWVANGYHSVDTQIVDAHSQDVSDGKPLLTDFGVSSARSESQFLPQSGVGPKDHPQSISAGSNNLAPLQNPVIIPTLGVSNSAKQPLGKCKGKCKKSQVQQKYANNQKALIVSDQLRPFDIYKKNMHVIASDASKGQPVKHDCTTPKPLLSAIDTRGKVRHESATDEEKQMQISPEVQVPITLIPDADDHRAGDSLLLRRIQCYGKTITCMVKHEKLYLLLEAMNRLYFPMRRLDTVIKAVTENLRVPVTTLTADEERDFIKFYKLPADKLNSNKVICVDDFVGVYKSLLCMLDNSFVTLHLIEPKTVVEPPAAVSEGLLNSSIPVVPVGIPVMNVSNVLHQSCTASNNAIDNSVTSNDRLPNMAQSCKYIKPTKKRGKFVNEKPTVATIDENTAEESDGHKRHERCRSRVIGEVIFIDD